VIITISPILKPMVNRSPPGLGGCHREAKRCSSLRVDVRRVGALRMGQSTTVIITAHRLGAPRRSIGFGPIRQSALRMSSTSFGPHLTRSGSHRAASGDWASISFRAIEPILPNGQ
jgi:hypothetical protein